MPQPHDTPISTSSPEGFAGESRGLPRGMDRRTFLHSAGSASLLAFLGISLAACGESSPTSPGDDREVSPPPPTTGDDDDGPIQVSGNQVIFELEDESLSGLLAEGGWMRVGAVGGQTVNLLVVNVGGGTIRAFSAVCPHAGCADAWRYTNQRFRCTCHDSVFENDGTRVSGPAPRNLTEFDTSLSDNVLTVTRG